MERPITSKPRGICRYYNEPRGCFSKNCKFSHPNGKLTRFDQSKTCKFYAQGFCRRGESCWFRHERPPNPDPGPSPSLGKAKEISTAFDPEDDPCCICLEKPITYGLLTGCSHVFCLQCISQWRDPTGKAEVGNIKKCPLCRASSGIITPSSHFYPQDHPGKIRAFEAYKASMARVPCRYFQDSKNKSPSKPFCPFGKDCLYQHRNEDGTPHIFSKGVDRCMRIYSQRRDTSSSTRRFDYLNHINMDDMNPINVLNILFQNPMDDMGATIDAIRASLFNVEAHVEDARRRLDSERAEVEVNGDLPPPLEPVGGWRVREESRRTPTAVEREMLGLERLAEHMIEGLNMMRRNDHSNHVARPHDEDLDDLPPLEDINLATNNDHANNGHRSDTDSMPGLQDISDSSDEEESSSDEETDYSEEDELDDRPRRGILPPIGPNRHAFLLGMMGAREDSGDDADDLPQLEDVQIDRDLAWIDPRPERRDDDDDDDMPALESVHVHLQTASTGDAFPASTSAPEAISTAVGERVSIDIDEEDKRHEDDSRDGNDDDLPPLSYITDSKFVTQDRPPEPPFVTDGRGRVVWSSSGSTSSDVLPSQSPAIGQGTQGQRHLVSSSASDLGNVRRLGSAEMISASVSTASTSATTGWGNVVGTQDRTDGDGGDNVARSSSDSAQIEQPRSLFGRMFDAIFPQIN